MNTDNRKLQEQHAPEKNTDSAFVQVGSDGQPVIPQTDSNRAGEAGSEKERQNSNQEKQSS